MIPSLLGETGVSAIPGYVLDALNDCQVLFVENERTARRYLKQLDKGIVIDRFEWIVIHKAEKEVVEMFREKLRDGKNAGIISEAGCPGVADPGQALVSAAQEMGATIKPLVGPNSILLALMASGLNGQRFSFVGYLPIDHQQRDLAIREMEKESRKKNATQIFIETPYRNRQMMEALLKQCHAATKLCIAVDLTSENQWIRTMTIDQWKKEKIGFDKRPAIFLILAP